MRPNYNNRIRKTLELKPDKAECLLVTSMPNVSYLTGFTGSSAALLLSDDKNYFLTDGRYGEQAREEVDAQYEILVDVKSGLMNSLTNLCKSLQYKNIGVEAEHFSLFDLQKFSELMAGAEHFVIETKDVVESVRKTKDDFEISQIKTALSIAEHSLDTLVEIMKSYIESGKKITERWVARTIRDIMENEGAETAAFSTIVLFGNTTSLPHGKPTDKILKKGDVILIDFGACFNGYNSDITRMLIYGRCPEKIKTSIQRVNEAKELALDLIKPDMDLSELDKAARGVLEKYGLASYFLHGLGHGIGLEVHEKPVVSSRSSDVCQQGMVFTVEPGIYLPGDFGIRLEDMALVTETGCQILNTSTSMLIRI